MNEVMMMFYQKRDRSLFRFVILAGPANDPENAEWVQVGRWVKGIEEAKRIGEEVYFRLYRERYGFAHPEDPAAVPADEMPDDVRVMVYRDGYDPGVTQTHTDGHAHPVH